MHFKKNITFFCTDKVEIQTIENIFEEAKIRKYNVKISNNILEKAEIGVYCQHLCFPRNSKFSMILLHDVAQGHNRWPNIWENEPWNEFDIGILPGKSWTDRWQVCSWHPYTRPRRGVYQLGWPKADTIFRNHSSYLKNTEALRSRLELKYEISILYAPSWENDDKQDQFVKSLKDLPVNLLLKQAPWSDSYPQILENIRSMNDLHRGIAPNVHVIDPDINIMYCIGLADLIVSEESSVMFEGLFLNVPSIAVTDWRIPDCDPPRNPSIPYDFVYKTDIGGLRTRTEEILENIELSRKRMKELKEENFINLGTSSQKIMDLIDEIVETNNIGTSPLVPIHNLRQVGFRVHLKTRYRKVKSRLRILLMTLKDSVM